MLNQKICNLLAQLEANAEDEREAIKGYYEMLGTINEYLNGPEMVDAKTKEKLDALVDQIEEIISDEMQHSERLVYFSTQLSGIIPSKD